MNVIQKILWAATAGLIPSKPIDEKDWRAPVIQNLLQPSSIVVVNELKEFTIVNGELYFRGSGGVSAWAISKAKAKEELHCIHNLPYGEI